MTQAELFHPQCTPVLALAPSVEVTTSATEPPSIEQEPQPAYAVVLHDYPHASSEAVSLAERRFRRELDRQLGDDTLQALRAFQNASESSESELSKDDIALARRWTKAYDAARTAGFRDLGDTDEAFFDVRAAAY